MRLTACLNRRPVDGVPSLIPNPSPQAFLQTQDTAVPVSPVPQSLQEVPRIPVARRPPTVPDRRVASGWMDDLFMVAYDDMRTYLGVFKPASSSFTGADPLAVGPGEGASILGAGRRRSQPQAPARRLPLSDLPLSAADLRLLGDLAYRLGHLVRVLLTVSSIDCWVPALTGQCSWRVRVCTCVRTTAVGMAAYAGGCQDCVPALCHQALHAARVAEASGSGHARA